MMMMMMAVVVATQSQHRVSAGRARLASRAPTRRAAGKCVEQMVVVVAVGALMFGLMLRRCHLAA